jgi:hypothetical protein
MKARAKFLPKLETLGGEPSVEKCSLVPWVPKQVQIVGNRRGIEGLTQALKKVGPVWQSCACAYAGTHENCEKTLVGLTCQFFSFNAERFGTDRVGESPVSSRRFEGIRTSPPEHAKPGTLCRGVTVLIKTYDGDIDVEGALAHRGLENCKKLLKYLTLGVFAATLPGSDVIDGKKWWSM